MSNIVTFGMSGEIPLSLWKSQQVRKSKIGSIKVRSTTRLFSKQQQLDLQQIKNNKLFQILHLEQQQPHESKFIFCISRQLPPNICNAILYEEGKNRSCSFGGPQWIPFWGCSVGKFKALWCRSALGPQRLPMCPSFHPFLKEYSSPVKILSTRKKGVI